MKNTLQKKPSGTALGVAASVMANVLWGFSFLAMKKAMAAANDNYYLVLGVRFIFGFLALLLIGLIKGDTFSMKGKKKTGFIALAVLEAVYFIFETLALRYSNSVFTGAILSLSPVVAIALAALFLKEIPSAGKVVFAVFPIIGVILMSVAGKSLGNVTVPAIVFMLGACFANASIKTIGRSVCRQYSTFERTISIAAVCAVVFNLVALWQADFDFGIYRVALDPAFIIPVLFLAMMCTVCAQMLINYAVGKLTVLHLTVFSALSTVVSTLAGIFILKEEVSWMTILGVALALFGIIMVNVLEHRAGTKKESLKTEA